MKNLFLAAVATIAFVNNAQAFDAGAVERIQSNAPQIIAAQCKQKWATDYDMQLWCREKQTKAAKELIARISALVTTPQHDVEEIYQSCADKWKYDFDMVVWCADKQLKAYHELKKQNDVVADSPKSTVPAKTDDERTAYGLAVAAAYETTCAPGTFTASILNEFRRAMQALPVAVAKAAIGRVVDQMEKVGDNKWCEITAPTAKHFATEFNRMGH
jgi:hypothetical protein